MGQGLVIPSRQTGSLLGTETPSLPRSRQGSHSVMEAASEDSLARQPQDEAAAQAAGPEAGARPGRRWGLDKRGPWVEVNACTSGPMGPLGR